MRSGSEFFIEELQTIGKTQHELKSQRRIIYPLVIMVIGDIVEFPPE